MKGLAECHKLEGFAENHNLEGLAECHKLEGLAESHNLEVGAGIHEPMTSVQFFEFPDFHAPARRRWADINDDEDA